MRYKDKQKLPNNEDEVKALHQNIRIVRLTRKSKSEGKSMNKSGEIGQKSIKILLSRLMVSGLAGGINEEKLRQLFPQCISATIPKGSIRKAQTTFSTVHFGNNSQR